MLMAALGAIRELLGHMHWQALAPQLAILELKI